MGSKVFPPPSCSDKMTFPSLSLKVIPPSIEETKTFKALVETAIESPCWVTSKEAGFKPGSIIKLESLGNSF